MIKKLLLTGVATLATSIAAIAVPGYVTLSGFGNATTPAQVILPADPTTAARLVNVNWGSDTNIAVLSISEGLGAYTITQTNASATAVTNLLDRTNGWNATVSVAVLQHSGLCYAATVNTFNSGVLVTNTGLITGGNNIVLASGGWGTNASIGDTVYLMSTATTLPIGASTNFMGGTLFANQYNGRPERVQLTPASTTNRLYSVVFKRE